MAETQACELAWSAADDGPAVLRPWRAVYRTALGVFALCVAVAGAIVVGDRHWSPHSATLSEAWPGIPPVPMTGLPTPEPATPSPSVEVDPAARPKAYALSPAADHLRPPPAPAVDGSADAVFLTGLQQTGSVITDVPAAIASGHSACTDLARGFTPAQVAAAVMTHNQTLSAVNALGMVYSAIAAYCPEQTP